MTTGTASSILGGGGVPVGGSLTVLDGPVNFTTNSQEYLKFGSIKAYDSSYATAVAAAPQLRVFGTAANTYSALPNAASDNIAKYYFVGTNYVGFVAGASGANYATTLANLVAAPGAATGVATSQAVSTALKQRVGFGNGYLVVTAGSNVAPVQSNNGSTFTAVGGTFTTFPASNVIAYLPSFGWLALFDLNNTPGNRAYIANINPTGTWTVDTIGALTMTQAQGVAANGSTIVVTGISASATAGKIFTSTTLAGAYTDRTATCGIRFVATDYVSLPVWTGTQFLAAVNDDKLIASTDGLTWTAIPLPIETSNISPVGATVFRYGISEIVTDGAGPVVIATTVTSTASVNRPVFCMSTDSGTTWAAAQVSLAGGLVLPGFTSTGRSVSFANGKWIFNYSLVRNQFIDCLGLTAPDFIGQQVSYAQGSYVRIK